MKRLLTMALLLTAVTLSYAGNRSYGAVAVPVDPASCPPANWNPIRDLSSAPTSPIEEHTEWVCVHGVYRPRRVVIKPSGAYMDEVQILGSDGRDLTLVLYNDGRIWTLRWDHPAPIANCGSYAIIGNVFMLKDCAGMTYRIRFGAKRAVGR